MRSRAHFKSHPLHPMLIALPIGFFVGCLLGDIIGRVADIRNLWIVGGYLSIATIISGLIAGIPGFIDYLYVVPPNSSAKKRATWHMLVNVAALALIAVGAVFRDWETFVPGYGTIVLQLIAAGLMSMGGWMGGTLVYRNQIAVDHRFAHAGKWREVSVSGAGGQSVTIAGSAEMKPGQMCLVRWKPNGGGSERRLVLARTDEGFTAFDDRCTHKGGSLAGGALICGAVQCPWHGSQFDTSDGQIKAGPAETPIGTYLAESREGQVYLTLPSLRDAAR